MAAPIKVGDLWDAFDAVGIRARTYALGSAFVGPRLLRVPTRGFADQRVASGLQLHEAQTLGAKPASSGKYGMTRNRRRPSLELATQLLMGDAAQLSSAQPYSGVQAGAFYMGRPGWTPHVWLGSEIAAQPVAPMLPIWVPDPNNLTAAQGTADGNAALGALGAGNYGVPKGSRVAIDMETWQSSAYCVAFRNVIAAAGYWCAIYGSASTLFANWPQAHGPGGGWWPAEWNGVPHLYAHDGVWATQYADAKMAALPWDMSVVTDLSRLWCHAPAKYVLSATVSDLQGSAVKSAAFTVG